MVEYQNGSRPPGAYRVVGTAKGLACKRNLYASGRPSIDEARQGVRIQAAQMGANALMNVVCEDKQEVDWAHNCWQTVVCVGDAIVTSSGLPVPATAAVPTTPTTSVAAQTRPIALRWEGFANLITGTVTLHDGGRRGTMSGDLPGNAGRCGGSYEMTAPSSGVWSVTCSNNMAASGTFEAYGAGKGSSGRGKDRNGNAVEYTIGGS